MAFYTVDEKTRMLQYVKDCVRAGFSERQAITYIEIKLGKPITTNRYYKLKTFLRSQAASDLWMNEQARFGFVTDYRDRIETVQKLLMDRLQDLVLAESGKRETRDTDYINELTRLASELNHELVTLQLGEPVIARIKADIDAANALRATGQQMLDQNGTYVVPTIKSSQKSRERDIREEQPILPETEF